MSTYDNQTGRLAPQSLLQQRYVIVGQAGRGGMGTVYQAMDTRIAQRRIAIKEMSQSKLSASELAEATARFQQEAAMLGALSHPNLPRIYDAFSEQGRFYLVMDYIEGKTLQQLLREAQGRPLPVEQVLSYARQLCDVLNYLHRRNPPIIFRDVKPSNIMITPTGQLFLIDFGIARFFKEGQEQDTMLLGSPGYAAPEQHGLTQTNPRTDLYGLGATLHYCLTGQDPYHAKNQFIFAPARQLNPQVPAELDQLIQRMVAQDERARPTSAAEVQQALTSIHQQAAEHTSSLSPALAATQYGLSGSPPNNPVVAAQAPTVAVNSYQQPTPHTPTLPQLMVSNTPVPAAKPLAVPHFNWFSALLLAVMLLCSAGSIVLFYTSGPGVYYGWGLLVEAGLSLLLTIIAGITSGKARGFASRIILVVTALAGLVAALAALILGSRDVQALLLPSQSSYPGLLDQLLVIAPAIAAIVSLYWPLHLSTRGDRLALLLLFGFSAICALLQFPFPIASVVRHILLLAGLILLIEGVLYATQAEQAQAKTAAVTLGGA